MKNHKVVLLICAWVLWTEGTMFAVAPGQKAGFFYHVQGAHETREACESARAKLPERKADPSLGLLSMRDLCLPDTVDPGSRWKP